MNAVVIEHVEVAKLPAAWRKRLGTAVGKVTVRIEADDTPGAETTAPESAVGMWKDREDMKDPTAWVRVQRASRFE